MGQSVSYVRVVMSNRSNSGKGSCFMENMS